MGAVRPRGEVLGWANGQKKRKKEQAKRKIHEAAAARRRPHRRVSSKHTLLALNKILKSHTLQLQTAPAGLNSSGAASPGTLHSVTQPGHILGIFQLPAALRGAGASKGPGEELPNTTAPARNQPGLGLPWCFPFTGHGTAVVEAASWAPAAPLGSSGEVFTPFSFQNDFFLALRFLPQGYFSAPGAGQPRGGSLASLASTPARPPWEDPRWDLQSTRHGDGVGTTWGRGGHVHGAERGFWAAHLRRGWT